MRLFWALELDMASRRMITVARAPLVRRWPELRWTDPDGWHVTLAFLGEVDAALVEVIVEGCTAALPRAGPEPPALTIPATASTPDRGRGGGIVWLDVDADESVASAAAALRAACTAAGAAADERKPFRPHVTLARVPRRSVPDPGALARSVAAAYRGRRHTLRPGTATLLTSRRTADGARYEALAHLPLT